MAAALTTAFVWRPAAPPRFTGLASLSVPMRVGAFRGHDLPVDGVTKGALPSAEILSREYVAPGGQAVTLTLIGGNDRSALHDPRSCLVGAGWRIDDDRVIALRAAGRTLPARSCVATITDASGRAAAGYDIVYLYVTHRRVIASATAIRMALLESALLDQSDAPVYYIRLITPVSQGVSTAGEHAMLTAFAGDFWTQVAPSLLQGEKA